MIIEQISRFTVKIILSEQELQNFGIDFSMLDSNNIGTKRMLLTLLDCVQRNVSLDLSSDRLFIEAFASGDGGCLLYISVIDEEDDIKTEPPLATIITQFSELGALTDFSKKFGPLINKRLISSRIYRKDNLFRLVIETDSSEKKALCRLLREYGEIIGTGECEYAATLEHWECADSQ